MAAQSFDDFRKHCNGDDCPELKDLYRHVTPHYAASWEDIGVFLDIQLGQLEVIKADHPGDTNGCCKDLWKKWLKSDAGATWKKLFDAVDSAVGSTVACHNTAEDVSIPMKHLQDRCKETRIVPTEKGCSSNFIADSLKCRLITERYFNLVYHKYGIPCPEDATWNDVKAPFCDGLSRMFLEVPQTLFALADLFEDARVEELVKKCKRLQLNSGNLYRQYIETINVFLDGGLSWGKVVLFFSFSASFAVYLSTNEMSHLAAGVSAWTSQILLDRLLPWINEKGGWEALLKFGKEVLSANKGGVITQEGLLKLAGQSGIVLGIFAVTAFAIAKVLS